MSTFVAKPLTVEAVKCKDAHEMMSKSWASLPLWFIDAYEGRNPNVRTVLGINSPNKCIEIVTKALRYTAYPDDWIIYSKGRVFVLQQKQFEADYEAVQNNA